MTKVTAEFEGLDDFFAEVEKKYSPRKIATVSNNALKLSSRVALVNLKKAVGAYRRTGKTVNEVVAGNPRLRGGVRNVDVGFRGDGTGQRWRLVHLNEFGYTPHGVFAGSTNATDSNGLAFYKPRGYHAIQDAFDAMKPHIREVQIRELKKGLM